MTKPSLLALLLAATAASAADAPVAIAQVFGVPLNSPCATVRTALARVGLRESGASPDGNTVAFTVATPQAAPFTRATSVRLSCNDAAQQPVEVVVTLAGLADPNPLREKLRLPASSGWSAMLLTQGTQAMAVYRRHSVAPRT